MLNDPNVTYAQVIDTLLSASFDGKKVAIELAKRYPDIFLELIGKNNTEQWIKDVIAYNINGDKVSAIKLIRANTSLGLKESKYINDRVLYEMNVKFPGRVTIPSYYYPESLRLDQEQIINKIVGAM